MFIKHKSSVASAIVWTDGIPIVMPTVDVIIIYRDELKSKRLFNKEAETIVVPWAEASELMQSLAEKLDDAHILKYESRPAAIEKFIRGLPRSSEKLEGVALDQIVDHELWETSKNVSE